MKTNIFIRVKEKQIFNAKFIEKQVSPIADISGYAQFKIAEKAHEEKYHIHISNMFIYFYSIFRS